MIIYYHLLFFIITKLALIILAFCYFSPTDIKLPYFISSLVI